MRLASAMYDDPMERIDDLKLCDSRFDALLSRVRCDNGTRWLRDGTETASMRGAKVLGQEVELEHHVIELNRLWNIMEMQTGSEAQVQ